MRGFEQNTVGPIGLDRDPLGGEALLVLNNELRAPLVSIVDGVVFADIGNVFPTVRKFSFTDLRESVGVGLRVRTPWVLLRGDYGFVLDPAYRVSRGAGSISALVRRSRGFLDGGSDDPPFPRRLCGTTR